jgi:hypothetical protein
LFGVFLADAVATGIAAWLLVCAGGHGGRGCLEAGLAWAWSCVALIAAGGVILGITGGFGAGGFLVFHGAVLAGLVLARRHRRAADWAGLSLAGRQARQFFNTPGSERFLGLSLLTILAGLMAISAWAEPAVTDALTYHLPRIGHWLQDGKIRALDSTDARLNFVAVLPDIVMAWLVGGVREGFRMTVVAQAIGGTMAVGATVGLARQSGLGRSASLLAGGLLLGMANVAVQFTAAQTDLFTAGVFAVSFHLWLVALRRGESSMLGAMGAGLALGAKGTLFYLGPSAVLWVGWLAWHHRLPWPQWRRTLLVATLGGGLFALPGFVRNWQAYGNALGPPAWVGKLHQGFDSVSGQLHKVYWNLTASVAQNFDPQSQPLGLRAISRTAGLALASQLPARDIYTLDNADRGLILAQILERREPDADVTAFGLVPLSLFLAGSLVALTRRRENARLILVWSAGVVTFLLFFHAMQQWHPYAFRYFVLVAPWVAIVAAWGIEQLGRPWRLGLWTLALAAALDVGWHVTTDTHQAGWKTVSRPERSREFFVASAWRKWSRQLDHFNAPFALALPEERPLAAFYRQWPRREVVFKPDPPDNTDNAEDFVRGATGWVIVPATRFLGREGRVAASVCLFEGDESNVFSLVAYRTLAAGERSQPIIYRQRGVATGKSVTYDLLVKPVPGETIRLALANPAKSARGYVWSTPLTQNKGRLAAGERIVVEMPLPVDAVGEIKIVFAPTEGQEIAAGLPTVEIVR